MLPDLAQATFRWFGGEGATIDGRKLLTAGLVLSGLDDWWGLREDPHRTVVAS